MNGSYPIAWIRSQFPAVLQAEAEKPPFAFLDNAAGSQMPRQVIDRIKDFFENNYVLQGGHYARSQVVTDLLERVRGRAAYFMGTDDPGTITFGLNASTLLRLFSTAYGELLKAGDEIIISGLEHEANVTPWLRLQHKGVVIKFWEPKGPEATLQHGDLLALISKQTKIVAVTGASNLLGTLVDLRQAAATAHEHGAIIVVDGVHYAPHRRISVTADDIDVFVCSGYKILGPKLGFLYCRKSILDHMPSLNHYFIDGYRLEPGAQNNEGIAGFDAVFDYMESLAGQLGIEDQDYLGPLYDAMNDWEEDLFLVLLNGLNSIKGVRVYGISDPAKIGARVATAAFRKDGLTPEAVSEKLCAAGFAVRYGHLYAPRITDYLKVSKDGGLVRVSLGHYNTRDEIDRLLEHIESI